MFGDTKRGEILYPLLRPYADQNVISAVGSVFLGSTWCYLGMLAGLAERWDDAEDHLDRALAMNRRTRATISMGYTHLERARMWRARDLPGDRQRLDDAVRDCEALAAKHGLVALRRKASELAAHA